MEHLFFAMRGVFADTVLLPNVGGIPLGVAVHVQKDFDLALCMKSSTHSTTLPILTAKDMRGILR
jgi:hypothetical protein